MWYGGPVWNYLCSCAKQEKSSEHSLLDALTRTSKDLFNDDEKSRGQYLKDFLNREKTSPTELDRFSVRILDLVPLYNAAPVNPTFRGFGIKDSPQESRPVLSDLPQTSLNLLKKYPQFFKILKPNQIWNFSYFGSQLVTPLRDNNDQLMKIGPINNYSGIFGSYDPRDALRDLVTSFPLRRSTRRLVGLDPLLTKYSIQNSPIVLCLPAIDQLYPGLELASKVIRWMKEFMMKESLVQEHRFKESWDTIINDLEQHYFQHKYDKSKLAAMIQKCFPFLNGWILFEQDFSEIYLDDPEEHLKPLEKMQIQGIDCGTGFYELRTQTGVEKSRPLGLVEIIDPLVNSGLKFVDSHHKLPARLTARPREEELFALLDENSSMDSSRFGLQVIVPSGIQGEKTHIFHPNLLCITIQVPTSTDQEEKKRIQSIQNQRISSSQTTKVTQSDGGFVSQTKALSRKTQTWVYRQVYVLDPKDCLQQIKKGNFISCDIINFWLRFYLDQKNDPKFEVFQSAFSQSFLAIQPSFKAKIPICMFQTCEVVFMPINVNEYVT